MDNEITQSTPIDTTNSINTTNSVDTTNSVNTTNAVVDYKLPEKFKTVNDLINSYGELEKKLGTNNYGAPETYKWELEGDEPDGVKLFKDIAKENNLSQSVFNKIVSGYLEKEKAIIEAQKSNINEIKQKIGSERIEKTKNLIKQIGLNQEQLNTLDKFVVGQSEFEVLETIVKKIDNSISTVTLNHTPSIDFESELEKIYNQPDYKSNPFKYKERKMELLKMQINANRKE